MTEDKTEERFTRIEATLEVLVVGQTELRTDVTELRADVTELRGDLTLLRDDVHELRRHMGVLHEEIIDRIKGLTLPVEEVQRQIRAGDAAVRADLGARLDVVEAALRLRRRAKRGP